ncbi:hypothetical protein [Spirosoma utsteinense]|uniref:Outer membrane protein beta-barrel domain-containing protein n=1 Tax=Spirosoma utsteinense TaxID=2585773 RepID=A0ABR6W0V9_9BACT|nr:hypothetical protein [Spirosoma utsteinense]MBC3783634.1 hypothetical protein [Spirosoma utsteinense]MBC3790223.1 hypothetical protein [Spirosoma utsteinense]
MSEFEQNIPDDFWRKAFEEAAETPPLRVWDAVERRLDESESTKILPLWGAGMVASRSVVWGSGLAAAIALLLVGWWVLQPASTEKAMPLAQHTAPDQANRVASASPKEAPVTSLRKPMDSQPPVAGRPAPGTLAFTPKNRSATASHTVQPTRQRPYDAPVASVQTTARPDDFEDSRIGAATKPVDEQPTANRQSGRVALQKPAPSAEVPSSNRVTFVSETQTPATVQQATMVSESALSFDPLHKRELRLRAPAVIQRIVWFRPWEPATQPDAVQPKRETREVWASVSMMPGAFDPSVGIQTAQTSFSRVNTLSNSSASQSTVNSRANFSVAYQAGAGLQLTERWSVESGVGYLAGRSTVDSPVQALAFGIQSSGILPATAGKGSNLYVDALRINVVNNASAAGNNLVANFDNSGASNRYSLQNSYNPQERQSLSNNYQFVQVPVQVGYQLRPRKRLGLALIGGFLSNIFVRNTVGDELVITSKDGVYRPVSWAATMGARFRYRPSRQWSASLAGVYQPSLGLGTRPESTVQSRPTSTGMSFGIDYHF